MDSVGQYVVHPNGYYEQWKDSGVYIDNYFRLTLSKPGIEKHFNVRQLRVYDKYVKGGAGSMTIRASAPESGDYKEWTVNLGTSNREYQLTPHFFGAVRGYQNIEVSFTPSSGGVIVDGGKCDDYGFCLSDIRVAMNVDIAGWGDKWIDVYHTYSGLALVANSIRWEPTTLNMTAADVWYEVKLIPQILLSRKRQSLITYRVTFDATGSCPIEARASWSPNAVYPIDALPEYTVELNELGIIGDGTLSLRGKRGHVGWGQCSLRATLNVE